MSNNAKWLWLAVLALVLSACGGDDDDDNGGSDEQKTPAVVKFIPVSARAPLVSVLIDTNITDDKPGTAPAGEQSHGQAVALSTVSGTQAWTFRYALPKAVGFDYKHEVFVEKDEFKIGGEKRYDVFVGGEYPDGEYWTVEMPRQFDERSSKARITLAHASAATTEELDFHLTKVGQPIDSASLLSTLEYKAADSSIRVNPGDYELKITAAGSDEVLYTSTGINLTRGADITLAAIDNAWIKEGVTGKSPLVVSHSSNSDSRLIFDANIGADLRVVHASPDAGNLDVALDDDFDQLLVQDIGLGESSGHQTVTGGVRNIKVVPANGSNSLIDTDYNLIKGVSWTMFIMRPVENIDPLFVSENARPIDGQARLRLVMGSSATGALTAWVTEEGADLSETETNDDGEEVRVHTPVGSNLRIRSVSSFTPVLPGVYDVTFTRTATSGALETVYGPVTVTLAGGEVYTLLLRDKADLTTLSHDWLDDVPEEKPSEEESE